MFSIGKVALQYAPPLFLTGSRMVFAGLVLLGFLFFKKRTLLKVDKKQLFSITVLAFFSIYLTNILEFWGLQYLSAAKTCFLYSLSPFFAALFSYLHFGEKMTSKKWLGLLIGFFGFFPVLFSQSGAEDIWNAFGFLSWPTLAIMGAALASVYGWVLLRLVVKDTQVSPLMANGTSMLIGGAFALFHSFFVDSWNPTPIQAGSGGAFLKSALALTVISNLICYNLYGMMLKKYTATFLSFVGLLCPIFASFIATLFFGEPLSWPIFLSTGIVSCGLFLVYQAELKQGYVKA